MELTSGSVALDVEAVLDEAFARRRDLGDALAAVEFLHPVIVGKRALPALAVEGDAAWAVAAAASPRFADALRVLDRPTDIAMGLSLDGGCAGVVAGLGVDGAELRSLPAVRRAHVPGAGQDDAEDGALADVRAGDLRRCG